MPTLNFTENAMLDFMNKLELDRSRVDESDSATIEPDEPEVVSTDKKKQVCSVQAP
jgi:hypothetical protein